MKQEEIKLLFPSVIRRTLREGNPLAVLLGVMEAMQAQDEVVLASLDAYFDPHRTTDAFVPFLACWVDLDRLFEEVPERRWQSTFSSRVMTSGPGRLRELIARSAFLSQWRGTSKGLLLFLQTATGIENFLIDENVSNAKGQRRPFHIKVTAPAEGTPHKDLIERIIEMEKPAHVTFELAFESADAG